jgi:hypothetical protein
MIQLRKVEAARGLMVRIDQQPASTRGEKSKNNKGK